MFYLLLTSFIWAFSFPLIGHTLASVDPYYQAAFRLLTALLVFLPFLRVKHISLPVALKLCLIGFVQYGLMYIFYLKAYRHLAPHEVALFTIFTPFYTALTHDLLTRRFHPLFLATACLSIAGTAIIKYTEFERTDILNGILLVQASNLCFAWGQIYYRKVMQENPRLTNTGVFVFLYAGAFTAPALWLAFHPALLQASLQPSQFLVLLYLGVVASGLAFFLWNAGARRVDVGALAIFNNLKIPLAIAVSLLVFHEKTDLPRLLIGGGIVALALLLNEILNARRTTPSKQ
ncbi:MAG: EamA family transporter [Kiritimatiellae bacterium]|nr:EamA family transporter [Kiritimatiellia bacterium]